ncbi:MULTISPECIES: phage tail protein [Xenorhabdus]|uniref:phage tail-collar fiber domain-containing protein n=1 Tax=Xenorhabdus TaxID=626 RepID=UPI00068E176D|nr:MULTISPECIES: phage tail protein [Xenorhabdus]
MSSVITTDFEKWKTQQVAAGNPVVLDEFVFAYVPDLDPAQPISRDEKLPAQSQIVHRQTVNKTGLASENAVAYSVTLGTEVGNFDFNWIGLINKASGVIGMITHAPTQKKIKTANGLQGNVLTRSFLLEFDGAAKETAITTTAETWQIDFTARLTGIDEMQRLINTDSYGEAAFFGDSFAVVRQGEQYLVKKGLAYIGGLRGMLEFDQTLNSLRNTRVYVDFSYQGNLVSQWKTAVKITVANELKNYNDAAGYPHYVFAIAQIDENGNVTDLRSKGTFSDRDIANLQKELGKVKQDYVTKTVLSNGLNEKQPKGDYATNSALNAVNNNANNRLEKAQNGADIPNKAAFVDNLGLRDTVKQASDAVPNSRKINGKTLLADVNLNAADIGAINRAPVGYINSGDKFADCVVSGHYPVLADNPATVRDWPHPLPQYGVLEVQNSGSMISQRYTAVSGEVAVRQKWPNNDEYHKWVIYSQPLLDRRLSTHGLGYGQRWQNVTAQRRPNTLYSNDTGQPIAVFVRCTSSAGYMGAGIQTGGGLDIGSWSAYSSEGTPKNQGVTAIIPPGETYQIIPYNGEVFYWLELRA